MPITFPIAHDLADLDQYYVVEDDFLNPASATASDYHAYTSAGDGGTGTNAFQDVRGGVFNLVTAAADNDYHELTSVAENWKLESGKKLWADFKIRLAESTTDDSTWWVGFSDTLTTGGMQANEGGPLASYDGMLIYKTPEVGLTVKAQVSNAAVQSTATFNQASVSNTWNRCQFYFDGAATMECHFYNGTAWELIRLPVNTTGLEEMHLVMGVKAGPGGAAETLQIDWYKVVATR